VEFEDSEIEDCDEDNDDEDDDAMSDEVPTACCCCGPTKVNDGSEAFD